LALRSGGQFKDLLFTEAPHGENMSPVRRMGKWEL
jgi:hypothetical protein